MYWGLHHHMQGVTGEGGPLNEEEFHVIQSLWDCCLLSSVVTHVLLMHTVHSIIMCRESTGLGGPLNVRGPHAMRMAPALHCRDMLAADVYCCRESTGLGGPLIEEEFHVIQGMLD
jgi:hypothetical protein